MKISNPRKLNVYKALDTKKPYVFTFECTINNTEILVKSRKENGTWECHYCSHASYNCEHCGEVNLYSNCYPFTDFVRENYDDVLRFLRENKSSLN